MSSPLIRWLLDLEAIPEDAPNLRLAWEHPWPAWLWAGLLLLAVALAGWSYTRLTGPPRMRSALAAVRCGVIVLALVILAGPMLELPRETVEPDWLLILADRSASMTIADTEDGSRRISREEQLRNLIDGNEATWRTLAEQKEMRWLGFHTGAFSLARGEPGNPGAPAPTELGDPSGEKTNLNAALAQALQQAAARPVSGVLVLSDGRSSDAPDRALLRRLQAERIAVNVVPLGSPEPLGDLALRRVDAPARAFVRDKVPVIVELDRFGVGPDGAGTPGAVVKLIDEFTGETLDAITLPPGDERQRVALTAEPSLAGEAPWKVVIETDEPDLVPENNVQPLLIELIDRPLRVLFVEGYPRWEYRYLKNLLVREKSVECSIMLLSADRDFAQEGDVPITRLPRSPEELSTYDVVVLGDVPALFFSPDQLELMRDHVASRGAGLLWIGGERHTPQSYAGTVLADLLPMRGSLELPAIGEPVNMQPTDLAERLGVLQLVAGQGVGWPDALIDPGVGWSRLQFAQRIEMGRLKPTADVLAHTAGLIDGAHLPLVMQIRYGAGQSIYVATDEIWRWRYGRGELLPDQFWIQMIRMLGRERLSAAGDRAVLHVAPKRLEVTQPMRIELRLLDAQLSEDRRAGVATMLETENGEKIADIELRPVPGSEDRFAATYMPEATGRFRVRINDPAFAAIRLTAPVEVFTPEDELRRPETNHDLLASLAADTGGHVLNAREIADLPELLPNRAVRTLNPLRERIWDTRLAFILVLVLLTAEWIGRKMIRLT